MNFFAIEKYDKIKKKLMRKKKNIKKGREENKIKKGGPFGFCNHT